MILGRFHRSEGQESPDVAWEPKPRGKKHNAMMLFAQHVFQLISVEYVNKLNTTSLKTVKNWMRFGWRNPDVYYRQFSWQKSRHTREAYVSFHLTVASLHARQFNLKWHKWQLWAADPRPAGVQSHQSPPSTVSSPSRSPTAPPNLPFPTSSFFIVLKHLAVFFFFFFYLLTCHPPSCVTFLLAPSATSFSFSIPMCLNPERLADIINYHSTYVCTHTRTHTHTHTHNMECT